MTKLSDSTDTGLPDNSNNGSNDNNNNNNGSNNNGNNSNNGDNSNNGNGEVKYDVAAAVSGNGSEWAYGTDSGVTFSVSGNVGALLSVSVDGNSVTLNASYLNTITMGKHTVTLSYQGGSVSFDFSTKEGTKEIEVIKLKPGTYTVTANIWFEKADSGLPMNPHLTNASFPPKDPVSNNATLKVDEDGRALVTVPIVIQSKVMTIQKISGLNIVSSTKDANGNLTSVTIDLGVLEDFSSIISKTCTVKLQMGDLAMSISGFSRDHTWKAHFQVNLSGVPTVKGTHTVSIGQNGETIAPQTGDSAPVLMMTVAFAAACAAALVIGKKRRKQH